MIAAIPFPDIGPDIFSVTIFGMTLTLRWYAMSYIVGLLIAWRVMVHSVRRPNLWPMNTPPMTAEQTEELLTGVIIGVVVGGRLGNVLFYEFEYYVNNPIEIFKIWKGGMAFHGGFLGVVIAGVLFCRKHNIPMLSTADMMALSSPFGLFLGRCANFINGELWGRPTDAPWGVIFPGDYAQHCPGFPQPCVRHPSQLYEAVLEGLLLGAILIVLAYGFKWMRRPGALTGVFIGGYGVARFVVEFFREPDPVYFNSDTPIVYILEIGDIGISMGQFLSLPMVALGLFLFLWSRRRT